MKITKLAIYGGILGMALLSLPVISTPAVAGRFNGSNSTGGNTSNNTGGNTSNNTGGNTSNNTGSNNSNSGKSKYNGQTVARARQISERLRIARDSGNQAEINAALQEAIAFLDSIKQPKPNQLQRSIVRSRQGW